MEIKQKENLRLPLYLKTFASKNIFAAAAAGDNKLIKKFLKDRVNINAKESDGNSALHSAVRYGHLHTVDFLRENGAFINIINNYNLTPYDIACNEADQCTMRGIGYTQEDIEILKQYLIDHGADTNSKERREYYQEHEEDFPQTPW